MHVPVVLVATLCTEMQVSKYRCFSSFQLDLVPESRHRGLPKCLYALSGLSHVRALDPAGAIGCLLKSNGWPRSPSKSKVTGT